MAKKQSRIVLDEQNIISSDSSCWILTHLHSRKRRDGQGTRTYENNTYHGTLSGALRAYADRGLKEAKSVEEVRHLLSEFDRKIEERFADVEMSILEEAFSEMEEDTP